MLILNLRKNGNSIWRLTEMPVWQNIDGENVPPPDLRGKKVAVLVSGYNVADAVESMSRVAFAIEEWGHYDCTIVVPWPGSRWFGFWAAEGRAKKAGKLLAAELQRAGGYYATLTYQGHSCGAIVVCEAAKDLAPHYLILAAAAIDDESIAEGGIYETAVLLAIRTLIAFSRHDEVLKYSYTFAAWDKALGLVGRNRDLRYLPSIEWLDLSADKAEHSTFKKSKRYYDAWRKLVGA